MKHFWLFGAVMLYLLVPVPSSAQSQTDSSFVLGPGDLLQISVWKDEALTGDVLIRPDGFFSFPLAGQIKAAGQTVLQVQKTLEAILKDYVPDAPVTVSLKGLNSTRIYLVGKINKPGMYLMQGKMTVMQALAASGGFTRFADQDDIFILRTRNGTQQAIPFDYTQLAKGKDLERNIVLQPGDTIVVP